MMNLRANPITTGCCVSAMVPLRIASRIAGTASRVPVLCRAAAPVAQTAFPTRRMATSIPRSQSGNVSRGELEAPPAPELGSSENYVNLLEDEDGSISINSVSLPDPDAPSGSEDSKSFITLSTGVSTDQPLIIINNTIFLWRPPPLSPSAVLKNTMNARLRQAPRPGSHPPLTPSHTAAHSPAPSILPDGWEAWLDKEKGQDEIWKLFEIITPKPDILLFGTGSRALPLPQPIRSYLANLGMQVDAQDSRNAASTFNLLKSEGRRVACALLPMGLPDA